MRHRRWVDKETLAMAREMDLLTYLQQHEPHELVRTGANAYHLRSNDSVKLSNGKWYRHSHGIGAVSALDFFTEVRGMHLVDAVELILGYAAVSPPPAPPNPSKQPDTSLAVCQVSPTTRWPPRNDTHHRMTAYLTGRGIDPAIIKHCYDLGLLYESSPYGNTVFVGRNSNGEIRYACSRNHNFMGEATGSKKRYSFGVPATMPSGTVQLFESPVDLLSYATLMKLHRQDPWQDDLLSLAGVSKTMKQLPPALERYLERNPNTRAVACRFDNDETGHNAAAEVQRLLGGRYDVISKPPPSGADYNEYLCQRLTQLKSKLKQEAVSR